MFISISYILANSDRRIRKAEPDKQQQERDYQDVACRFLFMHLGHSKRVCQRI